MPGLSSELFAMLVLHQCVGHVLHECVLLFSYVEEDKNFQGLYMGKMT